MTEDNTNPPSDKPTQPDPARSNLNLWAMQGYLSRPTQRFSPPTDIIELEDRIVILVEIAGMRIDNLKIALYNQSLVITGTRERPEESQTAAYHQAEIRFGDFKLILPMPWSIQQANVSANYRNGFLRVELPREQMRRIHIVDVNTDDDDDPT